MKAKGLFAEPTGAVLISQSVKQLHHSSFDFQFTIGLGRIQTDDQLWTVDSHFED